MEDETEKIIKDRFKVLPKDIQDVLTSPSFEEQIDFIRSTHELTSDKSLPLKNETVLFLLGFVTPEEYPQNLSESLGISGDEAIIMAEEINSVLINPVKTSLVQFLNSLNDKDLSSGASKSSNLATVPNDQPYTGGGLKSSIPMKDVNPFLPPLSKNANQAVPRIVVPPNVEVSDAFKGPAPEPLASELQTPLQATGEVVSRIPGKTTPVTSALAAELGSLLDQKPKFQTSAGTASPVASTPAPASTTPKAEPPTNLPIAAPQELPSTSVLPPKPPVPPIAPAAPVNPINKLNTMTQKPRVEVQMVKTAPASEKREGDPYREPIS